MPWLLGAVLPLGIFHTRQGVLWWQRSALGAVLLPGAEQGISSGGSQQAWPLCSTAGPALREEAPQSNFHCEAKPIKHTQCAQGRWKLIVYLLFLLVFIPCLKPPRGSFTTVVRTHRMADFSLAEVLWIPQLSHRFPPSAAISNPSFSLLTMTSTLRVCSNLGQGSST